MQPQPQQCNVDDQLCGTAPTRAHADASATATTTTTTTTAVADSSPLELPSADSGRINSYLRDNIIIWNLSVPVSSGDIRDSLQASRAPDVVKKSDSDAEVDTSDNVSDQLREISIGTIDTAATRANADATTATITPVTAGDYSPLQPCPDFTDLIERWQEEDDVMSTLSISLPSVDLAVDLETPDIETQTTDNAAAAAAAADAGWHCFSGYGIDDIMLSSPLKYVTSLCASDSDMVTGNELVQ